MSIADKETIIAQTNKWVVDVVAGCNFCPFVSKEIKRGTIHFEVLPDADLKLTLEAVMRACNNLDEDDKIETILLILPGSFESFDKYLQLVELAEELLEKENYEGIYQLATFHPNYLFHGSDEKDPSNYTNRSPYPMLHFLREESVSKAIDGFPGIDEVPMRNIHFTKEKGLAYMQQLFISCVNYRG